MDTPDAEKAMRDEIQQWELTFRYQLLDRMRLDCDYFLAGGNGLCKYLWAGTVEGQIQYMKALWNSFREEEKQEWLSYTEICSYEARMRTFHRKSDQEENYDEENQM